MVLTYNIGGVLMGGGTNVIARDSEALVNALGQRDTLTFKVNSKDRSYTPAIGAKVIVTDEGATVRFLGNIRQLKVSQIGAGSLSECACASFEQVCDRRLTGQRTYTNTTCGAIFSDLILNCMGGENINSSVAENGPTVNVTFDYITNREAFDQLAALASDDTNTYAWDIVPVSITASTARFYRQDSYPAPFQIDDADLPGRAGVLRAGGNVRASASWSLDKYINRVHPRMSQLIGDSRPETFGGDGAQTVFRLSLPCAVAPFISLISEAPTLADAVVENFTSDGINREYYTANPIGAEPSVTVDGSWDATYTLEWSLNSACFVVTVTATGNQLDAGKAVAITYQYFSESTTVGTAQTVGESGVDTSRQWYWTRGGRDIAQDSTGTPVTNVQTLQITYQAYEDRALPALQNDAEVNARAAAEGGTGYYETVLFSDQPGAVADANARAQAMLDKYSQIPCVFEYPTTNTDLKAGMYQTINIGTLGINGTFLIESVNLTRENGRYLSRVKAVAGALTGDYKQRLKELKQGVNSPPTPNSGSTSESGDSGLVSINGVPVTY